MHYQRQRNHGSADVATQRRTGFDWLVDLVAAIDDRGCVDWPFAMSHGYGVLRVDGCNWPAHRLACELMRGPAPAPDMHAAHNCGRSSCVNPHHLRWATPTENQADRLIHGTHNRGERYGASKLTEADVLAIRDEFSRGVPQRALAERHGVSQGTISDVTRGRSWGWL